MDSRVVADRGTEVPPQRPRRRGADWWFRRQRGIAPYLFIAPNLILFSAFSFLPLLYAMYISFHDWGLISEPAFIGSRNYLRLLHDRCSGNRWRTR